MGVLKKGLRRKKKCVCYNVSNLIYKKEVIAGRVRKSTGWNAWQKGKKQKVCERKREREREREQTSLQGGFPEVTVLNIREECGMVNCCQGKHTIHPQWLLYIYTKQHKHTVMYE